MERKEEDPFQECDVHFFIKMKFFSRLVAMKVAKKKEYRFRLFMYLKIDLFFFLLQEVYLCFFLVTPKSLFGL